jgi:hypothetical protein
MGIITDTLYKEHKEKLIAQMRERLVAEGIGLQELHDKLSWGNRTLPIIDGKGRLLNAFDSNNHDTTLLELYHLAEALGCELTITFA